MSKHVPMPMEVQVTTLLVTTKKRKHFSLLFDDDYAEPDQVLGENDAIIAELKTYKLNHHQLPFMGKIAKMLFCVTASSAPSVPCSAKQES